MNSNLNFIDKLLEGAEVEWKTLGEVTFWDKRFQGVNPSLQPTVLSFKHISAEKLKSLKTQNGDIKLLSTGNFDGFTTEIMAENDINIGEVITIPTGGTANLKYYSGKFVDSGNLLACTSNEKLYNLKYVYYFLLNVNNVIQSCFRGSGVAHPNMIEILKLPIPIPPLSVQKEIVRILDTFTNLTEELTSELSARKKQYNYYREHLLSFETGEVEWKTLNELTSLITKGTTPKNYTDTGISFIKTEAFDGTYINPNRLSFIDEETHNKELKRSILNQNDILITIAGATIGKCAIVPKEILPANTNQALAIIRLKPDVNLKYVFHLIKSNYLKKYIEQNVKGSAQPNLNLEQLNNFLIPIPPIEEQERIVSILDKFDTLTTSISEGLPKEIELRKKQYEYYRNLMLSFEPQMNTDKHGLD